MAPNGRGRDVQEALTTRVQMTTRERARYVRWWIERSGLTAAELREIATGVWPFVVRTMRPAEHMDND